MEALRLPHHRHGCMVHDTLTVVKMEELSCQTDGKRTECCDLNTKRHNPLSKEQPWLWQKFDGYCLILPSQEYLRPVF